MITALEVLKEINLQIIGTYVDAETDDDALYNDGIYDCQLIVQEWIEKLGNGESNGREQMQNLR